MAVYISYLIYEILKSLIFPFLRENVNLPKKIWQKLHLFFTCQTIKTLVTGICVFGGFKNRFLSNFFGRLTFSRKNVNLPKQIWVKMEMIKTLGEGGCQKSMFVDKREVPICRRLHFCHIMTMTWHAKVLWWVFSWKTHPPLIPDWVVYVVK